MHAALPFSQACENNKAPILTVLQQAFATCTGVLEIGSGTGQHAVHFAQHLTQLTWQATDQPAYLPALAERLRLAELANLPQPMPLDIRHHAAPGMLYDGLFTANTLHIMPWPVVELFFRRLSDFVTPSAVLCIYGPFNYDGSFTSVSNQAFDASLKSRDPAMGIRDIEAVIALANASGFQLRQDHAMPANNRLLQFSAT